MNLLVVCLHVIVCLVLILVILLQAGRGQGLTGASFGGNVQSLFGTKASSFLTKATSVCAVLFLFTCVGLNILEVRKSRSLFKSPNAQTPLDIEQIKKALEKMKKGDKTSAPTIKVTEAAKTNDATATATAGTAATKLATDVKTEAAKS